MLGFRVVCGLSVHRFCLSCDVLVLTIEARFFTPSGRFVLHLRGWVGSDIAAKETCCSMFGK